MFIHTSYINVMFPIYEKKIVIKAHSSYQNKKKGVYMKKKKKE